MSTVRTGKAIRPYPRLFHHVVWLYSQLLYRQQLRRGDLFGGWSGVLILLYHDVCPPDGWSFRLSPRMSITPATFEKQIAWLGNYVQFVDMDRAVDAIQRGTINGSRLAVITSDDGWRGFHIHAGRFLYQQGIPALVYVASVVLRYPVPWFIRWKTLLTREPKALRWLALRTGHDSATASPDTMISYLTRCDLRMVESLWEKASDLFAVDLPSSTDEGYVLAEHLYNMLRCGIHVGAHTVHHVRLTSDRLEQAREEIEGSKRHLEEVIREPVNHFAYPYGDHNEQVRQLVAQAGFRSAVTTQFGWNRCGEDLFRLHRVIVSEWVSIDHRGNFSESMFWCTLTGQWAKFLRFRTKLAHIIEKVKGT